MLAALSAIASDQAAPTEKTTGKILFLYYVASHPDLVLTYNKINMALAVCSTASYQTERKTRSRVGGHFFSATKDTDENNGAIPNIAKILRCVVTSTADAEFGALFINTRNVIPARNY